MTLEENVVCVPSLHLITKITKLDNILNGRYLSLEDNIFVENVVADIQHFLKRGEDTRKSVLIFPPVNNYRRFLIHKVCEENLAKELSTFSVGQGFNRRTVVCLKGLVRKPNLINKSHDQPSQHLGDQTSNTMVVERQAVSPEVSSPEHHCQNGCIKRVRATPAIYRPPAARKMEALNSQIKQGQSINPALTASHVSSVPSKTERIRSGTRQRRPDLQVYVPRAKRASMIDQNLTEQHIGHQDISTPRQTGGTKKNASESQISSKFQNISVDSDFDKDTKISSTLLPVIDSNSGEILNKMDVEYPVIKKKFGNVVIENNIVKKPSRECYSENYASFRNDISDCVPSPFGCDTKDVDKVFEDKIQGSDVATYETREIRNSPHPNVNGCVSEMCNTYTGNNNNNENSNVLNYEIHEVSIDSKQCDEEKHTNSECVVQENTGFDKTYSSTNLSDCNKERTSQPTNFGEKCSVPDGKSKENQKCKKIVNEGFISDILVISDSISNEKVVDGMPKDAGNVVKDNMVSKKTKSKLMSSDSSEAEKPESVSNSTAVTSSTTASISPVPDISLNPDECTWDMLFDDNGDCLDPKIMEELTSAVGSVTIEKPQSDYNRFISKPEINLPGGDDEYSHVLEIYNFPSEFKTQDLLSIFSPFKNGGFEIKWVDDTHALGVFSSSRVAADVLVYEHPFVKTRPLSEATPESRIKAKRSAEFLQPYRTRPETCVAMARRLVTGALGMRVATSREEREAERRLLKEAKEKKRLAAQQQQDAWEGTIR